MAVLVLCVLFIRIVFAEETINLHIPSESVIKGIEALATSQYLRGLADEFIVKAAQHLINQYGKEHNVRLDNKTIPARYKEENQKKWNGYLTPSLLGPETGNQNDMITDEASPIIDDQLSRAELRDALPNAQILAFLQQPSADGDNVDREYDLTDYEYNKPKTPLKTEYKINGRHFRRVPDFILFY